MDGPSSRNGEKGKRMNGKDYPDSEVRYFDGITECIRCSRKLRGNAGYRVFEWYVDEPDVVHPVKVHGCVVLTYNQVKKLMEEVM